MNDMEKLRAVEQNREYSRLWVERIAPAIRSLTDEHTAILGINVREGGVGIRIMTPETKPHLEKIKEFEDGGRTYESVRCFGCHVSWEKA